MSNLPPSLGDSSSIIQSHSINVVLFGETGVGKSSVVNLIAQKDIASVSSDVSSCTMQSTRYDISFDGMNFAIFDTVGLDEPQMEVDSYLTAVEQGYDLIAKLTAAGGIHLLLFCMRGGRITATTQSNYRLFSEYLCSKKVPTALIFTGLETLVDMEEYWTESKADIERYGIKSDGHACITAVQDDASGEDSKYMESQKRIRELLTGCALKNGVFSPEPHSWFAKIGKGMRSFVRVHTSPKKKDVMKVLVNRCKLDPEAAMKIADMMQKDDLRVGNIGGEGRSTSNSRVDQRKESAATDDSPPKQLGDTRPELHIPVEEKGGRTRVAQTRNVVFIGASGSGKSSIINLIADHDCAPVSNDARPGTVTFTPYEISIGKGMYRLWDTPGIDEFSGIERFFRSSSSWPSDPIKKFLQERRRRGELDLLVYCVRGTKAHRVMSRAYNTFCRPTRQNAVPVAIAITHLEKQQPAMEAWWENNERELSDLQLVFDGHACITCLSPHHRRWASQQEIRELISISKDSE